MMKFFSLLLLVLIFSGCAILTKKFESLTETKAEATRNLPLIAKNNYCPADSKFQFISEDEALLKFYKNLNSSLFENKNISFAQKAVMFSLIEMSRRPDVVSPYSRLQVYIKLKGKNYYFDFYPKNMNDENQMSYLRGLETLTQKFIPGKTLLEMASITDKALPLAVNVSVELETFLKENKEKIVKNEILTESFIKGDEILTRYETFNRLSFRTLIQQYQTLGNSKASDYNIEPVELDANTNQKENFKVNCNYNLHKDTYQNDELNIFNNKKNHSIGLSEGEEYFLAVSSANLAIPYTTNSKLGYFMKASPTVKPLPICEFKGQDQEIVLFSNDGRNPVQHLQHLLSYGADLVNSNYSLNELLNFSRHLFLSNPDRILYESKRGRKAQLDFFLAMNFPIYHVDKLGNIFGHASFKTDKKVIRSLHIDDRSQARLWCK